MEIEKIRDRIGLLQAHLKKTDIPKSMKDMIQSAITASKTIEDADQLNMMWNTIRSQNNMLGDNKCVFTQSTTFLPPKINAETEAQYAPVRKFLIESFQLVGENTNLLRGRNGRVLNAEEFAEFIITPNMRRLKAEYDSEAWDGKHPITLQEVEETNEGEDQ